MDAGGRISGQSALKPWLLGGNGRWGRTGPIGEESRAHLFSYWSGAPPASVGQGASLLLLVRCAPGSFFSPILAH